MLLVQHDALNSLCWCHVMVNDSKSLCLVWFVRWKLSQQKGSGCIFDKVQRYINFCQILVFAHNFGLCVFVRGRAWHGCHGMRGTDVMACVARMSWHANVCKGGGGGGGGSPTRFILWSCIDCQSLLCLRHFCVPGNKFMLFPLGIFAFEISENEC